MALFASILFVFAFLVAVGAIVGTVLPARQRILQLLRHGPETTIDPLPPVRLSSRRGVIRQRTITGVAAPVFREAA